jgi:hypothetical protein
MFMQSMFCLRQSKQPDISTIDVAIEESPLVWKDRADRVLAECTPPFQSLTYPSTGSYSTPKTTHLQKSPILSRFYSLFGSQNQSNLQKNDRLRTDYECDLNISEPLHSDNDVSHSAPAMNYPPLKSLNQVPIPFSSSIPSDDRTYIFLENHRQTSENYDPFDDDDENHIGMNSRYYQSGIYH